MKFIEMKKQKIDDSYSKVFKISESITIDDIKKIIRSYEIGNDRLYKCYCQTYTEAGNVWTPVINGIEEINKVDDFPNPNISFKAYYIDKETNKYKFELNLENNSNVMILEINENRRKIIDDELYHIKTKK